MAPQGRKIAFLGATGQVGAPTLKALLAQGVHTITAIQRCEATSSFSSEIIVKSGDLEDEAFIAEILKGQDALILMPPLAHIPLQKGFIRAAAKAGVPYILPSEFGPDPFAMQLVEENVLLQDKKAIRDLIDELGVSSWVSVTIGPWLDQALAFGLWGIDAKARKATLWGGADSKANTATVQHTAEATAAVLSLPDADLSKYRNKAVYTPSWLLSQREILQAVQRVTGTSDVDWDITEEGAEDVVKDYEAKMKKGEFAGYLKKFFYTHFLQGHGGDFEHKVVPAEVQKLEQFGLQKENLEEVIKATLK